jgi:uncharacterized protein (TIGR02391 family)
MRGPVRGWTLPLDKLVELPAETLAFELLPHVPSEGVLRTRFIEDVIESAGAAQPGPVSYQRSQYRRNHPQASLALAEAIAALERLGLLVAWPPPQSGDDVSWAVMSGGAYQLTALGRQMQQRPNDAQARVDARRRIGLDLHPMLAARLRDQIAVGDFEQAALIALRAIESRVHCLADPLLEPSKKLTAQALMTHAFRADGGPLADPAADPSVQTGTMQLFAGTFSAVRNLLAHTEVEWPDPSEAAEYVLLADLLMRILDRAEHRLQSEDRVEP